MRTVWLGCLLSVVLVVGGGGVVRAQEPSQYLVEKAGQGDADAQLNLGVMFLAGAGVRQDFVKAKEWYGRACDNGNKNGCETYRALNEKGY